MHVPQQGAEVVPAHLLLNQPDLRVLWFPSGAYAEPGRTAASSGMRAR